ncbi:MAG TPA: lactate utilization protein C [Pseudonocardiaceae bacterium]|nr:lactate utilization protein C [Pseudonocardiaceae bacterium]
MADARDTARTEILGRIRTALSDHPDPPPARRDYDRTGEASLELFAERVADYRAVVHVISADEVVRSIAEALRRRGARHVVAPVDLPGDWRVADVEWLLDEPLLSIEQLDRSDGVVTGCAVAIANTGTIVLDGGQGQGRRALTLLPDYHLCVVRADQVAAVVPEALARLDPTRPLTFISGPSATSDIELKRVEGVHGPRNLEVLIVR